MFYFSLGIILFVFAASFFQGRFFGFKSAKCFFYFSLSAVFVFFAVLCVWQFIEWGNSEPSKYLLPPHQPINYFAFYCFSKFFGPYLISAFGAFSFLLAAMFFNKKSGERFFEPEEPYFGALGIFLSGWPGFLFYAVFLIGAYLLAHIYSLLFVRRTLQRVPLYYLWLPAALFVIIINNFIIQNWQMWSMLKI